EPRAGRAEHVRKVTEGCTTRVRSWYAFDGALRLLDVPSFREDRRDDAEERGAAVDGGQGSQSSCVEVPEEPGEGREVTGRGTRLEESYSFPQGGLSFVLGKSVDELGEHAQPQLGVGEGVGDLDDSAREVCPRGRAERSGDSVEPLDRLVERALPQHLGQHVTDTRQDVDAGCGVCPAVIRALAGGGGRVAEQLRRLEELPHAARGARARNDSLEQVTAALSLADDLRQVE